MKDTTSNVHGKLSILIAQGDECSFRVLFDYYYQKLFHVAIYFLKNREVAEEVVSDVFMMIWKKREALAAVEDLEKYLYVAVKNQALHYIRRGHISKSEKIELYQTEMIEDSTTPEKQIIEKEYHKLIQEAIDSLPEKCREVFRLSFSDKMKQKDIASLLNISIKTVEAHVSTAYKRIATYVNKEYNTPSKDRMMLSIFF